MVSARASTFAALVLRVLATLTPRIAHVLHARGHLNDKLITSDVTSIASLALVDTITADTDLSYLASFDMDLVRRASIFVQDPPLDADACSSTLAPLHAAWRIAGPNTTSIETARAAAAMTLFFLGHIYILGRAAGTDPHTDAELVQRAARFTSSAIDGSLPTILVAFFADATPPPADPSTPSPVPPPPPTIEQRAKQARWWASRNEWGRAFSCFDRPGMGDDPGVIRKLTPQTDEQHPLPSPADVADEPGVPPYVLDYATFL